MSVAPLTDEQVDALPHSFGATFPRDSFLRCQCGYTGTARSVSSHRSSAGKGKHPVICTKDPDVFMSLDDAQIYEAEFSAEQKQERREEEDRMRREYLAQHPDAPVADPDPPKRPRGRPRKYPEGQQAPAPTNGESRPAPGTERVDVPRPLTSRMTFDVSVDVLERCNRVRLDPEFGFNGDVIDYLTGIERDFWKIVDWLAEGQQTPLAALAMAA